MYLSGYLPESINEGEGLRAVISISGCKHNCIGCHSKETHNFKYGIEFSQELQLKIIEEVKNNPLLDGLTLCGGDPFFSAKEAFQFVKLLKSELKNINIWIYSGFTFEQIIRDNEMLMLLKECDVLVDGKFVAANRDVTLRFRGSSNQNIVDIQESLKQGQVVSYLK